VRQANVEPSSSVYYWRGRLRPVPHRDVRCRRRGGFGPDSGGCDQHASGANEGNEPSSSAHFAPLPAVPGVGSPSYGSRAGLVQSELAKSRLSGARRDLKLASYPYGQSVRPASRADPVSSPAPDDPAGAPGLDGRAGGRWRRLGAVADLTANFREIGGQLKIALLLMTP
jgi:hypothetical protein